MRPHIMRKTKTTPPGVDYALGQEHQNSLTDSYCQPIKLERFYISFDHSQMHGVARLHGRDLIGL